MQDDRLRTLSIGKYAQYPTAEGEAADAGDTGPIDAPITCPHRSARSIASRMIPARSRGDAKGNPRLVRIFPRGHNAVPRRRVQAERPG